MAENTKIQWCHATFNPWRGCTRVSSGCANCYAETLSGRNPKTLGVWGPNGTRVVASEAQWRLPVRWNKAAQLAGERHRVFCASLADVFEQWTGPMETSSGVQLWRRTESGDWTTSDHYRDTVALTMDDVRRRLLTMIRATPHLSWLLLTKRPEHVAATLARMSEPLPDNVWLGTSVENKTTADERIPALLAVPAKVRFLSCEPLLESVELSFGMPCPDGYETATGTFDPAGYDPRDCAGCGVSVHNHGRPGIDWVIVGGESGPGARPFRVEWARDIIRQCKSARAACFVKQLGETVRDRQAIGYPGNGLGRIQLIPDGVGDHSVTGFADRKGGDPAEWPADLRVREFPR